MRVTRSWLWLLVLIPLAAGIARLRFDVEVLNLLPSGLGVVEGLKLYQERFSNGRELVVALEGPTAEETEVAARTLAGLLRAHSNLVARVTWQSPWLESPAEASEILAFLWLNQPAGVFGQLTNRLTGGGIERTLQDAREQLTLSLSPDAIARRGYDPFDLMRPPVSLSGGGSQSGDADRLFSTTDGTFRLVFVEAKPDIVSYRDCLNWLHQIRAILNAALDSEPALHDTRMRLTGRPVFVTEIAGGMEGDMLGSSSGTLLTIGILFYLTHRRLRPLALLLFLLLAILACTTALGGLFLGGINVVSMGFASILLGLAEDFGILTYQEFRSHPESSVREIRRVIGPGIFWSAVTTAGAFLLLNLSVLPGLGQLGTLVALGIGVAAVVMLWGYLPMLPRLRRSADGDSSGGARPERWLLFQPVRLLPVRAVLGITALVSAAMLLLLTVSPPEFDPSPNPLKPRQSEANATLELIKTRFQREREPLWVLIPAGNRTNLTALLAGVESHLRLAVTNGWIDGFTLPTHLWPDAAHQRANGPAIGALLRDRDRLHEVAAREGFSDESLAVTGRMLDFWARAASQDDVVWPTNSVSQWVMGKVASRNDDGFLALGLIHPSEQPESVAQLARHWPESWTRHGLVLSGWELLGSTVFNLVVREMPRVLAPIFALVLVSLWLAFRNPRDVLLSLATLAFGVAALWSAMGVLRWEWNLINLMAMPLLLGMGVDFSIHIQLALRRENGNRLAVRRSVGRALLLAGATTVAGFGSLAFSSNAGMASLGKVCALGILLMLMVAVYLLPVWWEMAHPRKPATKL